MALTDTGDSTTGGTTTAIPDLLAPINGGIDYLWNNYIIRLVLIFIGVVYLAQLAFKLIRDIF